jgi:2'-5' RNA ligase
MPRFVVVLPLMPLQTGESFATARWPLHITALAPFETDAAPCEIARLTAAALAGFDALTVVAGQDELFGRRHDILVTVVNDNAALTQLHDRLVEALRPLATDPNESAFTGPEFRAHVTVKQQGRVQSGDELRLTQVAVVDMAPRTATSGRTVLATLDLDDFRAPTHPRTTRLPTGWRGLQPE